MLKSMSEPREMTPAGDVSAGENRWLDMLQRAAQKLQRQQEIEALARDLVDTCLEATTADSCFIYVYEPSSRDLVLRASSNAHPDEVGRLCLRIGEGITGWVAQQRRPVALASDAMHDPRFKFYSALPEDSYQAMLSAPMLHAGQVLGVINLQHREKHPHTPEEIQAISLLGLLAGEALERARLAAENETLAQRCSQHEDALATRKLIERAKGVLQQQLKISEEEAYRRLQNESRRHRRSMAATAQAVLASQTVQNELLKNERFGQTSPA